MGGAEVRVNGWGKPSSKQSGVYFIESVEKFGVIKGSFKGIKRILSCHPIKFLGGGDGFDPVIKKKLNKYGK